MHGHGLTIDFLNSCKSGRGYSTLSKCSTPCYFLFSPAVQTCTSIYLADIYQAQHTRYSIHPPVLESICPSYDTTSAYYTSCMLYEYTNIHLSDSLRPILARMITRSPNSGLAASPRAPNKDIQEGTIIGCALYAHFPRISRSRHSTRMHCPLVCMCCLGRDTYVRVDEMNLVRPKPPKTRHRRILKPLQSRWR